MSKPLAQKKFNLTERQAEIAKLAATGASYKKIADKVKLSPHTVKFHLSTIRARVGAFSAYELVCIFSHYRFR